MACFSANRGLLLEQRPFGLRNRQVLGNGTGSHSPDLAPRAMRLLGAQLLDPQHAERSVHVPGLLHWRQAIGDNFDPGLINPCLLIWGCSPPTVMIPTTNQGHPHINKQGFINPGSTLREGSGNGACFSGFVALDDVCGRGR